MTSRMYECPLCRGYGVSYAASSLYEYRLHHVEHQQTSALWQALVDAGEPIGGGYQLALTPEAFHKAWWTWRRRLTASSAE